jgi:predicted metalloprotease with PDZ domain
MTHNWAQMPGASALISRWAEGMAEFYSLRLLWRSGLLSTALYLQEMNSRLASYYGNSYVNVTDTEAYDEAWSARDAQRIPYGRGLIELANLDAAMRNQSLTLDNLTHDMRQLCVSSASACTPASWVNVTAGYLGPSAVTEYNRVTSGKPLLVPVAGSLGPCFDVVRTETQPETWAWQAKSGVNISSEACVI